MSVSIVQYFGEQTSKCGYCAGFNCSRSHGMHAYRLSCEDYQELIDRGWRRCGYYCYKPRNDISCCPCYTIKCDSQEFKLSRSHKRILRRMNKFLRDGKREPNEQQPRNQAGKSANGDNDDVDNAETETEPQPQLPSQKPLVIDVDKVESLVQAQEEKEKIAEKAQTQDANTENGDQQCASAPASKKSKPLAPTSNPPRKKAKQMRLERRQAKLGASFEPPPIKTATPGKSLRDFLATSNENDKHQLKIVLVAASDIQRTCADAVLALYRKYQIAIHNDNPARLTLASMQRFLVKSPLKLKLVYVHSEEFQRTLRQSYELYSKYQRSIHNDPPSRVDDYKDHLQKTPMKHEKPDDGPEMGYGSFHQQYWLDDKLIAVGVIDILPGSVSSVYFFYDPDYNFLSLGTYGSLREIDLVQTIAERVPAIKYYYMGFYIHSCPKMRYKGKLSASYLLCPETYVWLPLTDAMRSKLDEKKYQRLNTKETDMDANKFSNEHLDDIKLLLDAKNCISYKHYFQLTGDYSNRDEIMEYGSLVGKVCAERMLFVNKS